METENKITKAGRICGMIAKVFYCLACAACLTFVALSVALSCTSAIKSLTDGETAILFATLALYSFIAVGLLWNVEGVFKSIVKDGTPFGDGVRHYLKKIGIFLILISTVPAFVGTTLLHSIVPATEMNFPVELGGIIAGVVVLVFCLFFRYGKEQEGNK